MRAKISKDYHIAKSSVMTIVELSSVVDEIQ